MNLDALVMKCRNQTNALGTAAPQSTVFEQQSVRRTCCFSVVNFPSTRSYPPRLERKGLPLRAHAYSSISFRYIICLDTLTLPPTGWMRRYYHCLITPVTVQHHLVGIRQTFRKYYYLTIESCNVQQDKVGRSDIVVDHMLTARQICNGLFLQQSLILLPDSEDKFSLK